MDLDTIFRPAPHHGQPAPEGVTVFSARFGSQRADIWLDGTPRRVRDEAGAVIAELHHPVWRISAGTGSIAATEAVARHRAEAMAIEAAGGPLRGHVFTNPATSEEIAADRDALNRMNAEALAIYFGKKWAVSPPVEGGTF